MRKLLWLVLMGALFSFVLAQTPLEVWKYEDGQYISLPATNDLARAFSAFPEDGSCNKPEWQIVFTTEVQVAQWLEWSLNATKWTWFVRKPGDYYANAIVGTVASNGDVLVTFSDFDDPTYTGTSSVNPTIEAYYTVMTSEGMPDPESWVRAPDVNDLSYTLTDSQELHEGMSFYLWNRIKVVECNSASTYRDTGYILLTLQNQKPWIDEEGNYVEDLANYVTNER
ncbi:hypothetical protein [Thermotoga sp. SG1]|uniref:hypothetical protein n=1 Tax=Thermotoga sp. SG1 TaxID=126739 RepID=UPI000C779815|nr:hypothetical protein [Thermotoga sp. SG1]PLV56152.1 hypothetical protein AS006_06210 [Thermotoga sp. SG1]